MLLVALGLAIFYPMVDNFFVSDSFDWLLIGRDAQFPNYLFGNYTGEQAAGSYRPLITFVMSGMFVMFGKAPAAYHLLSIALHVLTSFCVYVIAVLLMPRVKTRHVVGFFAALLFLVIPTHSEVVMWVAGYPDAFAGFFISAAIVCFIMFCRVHAKLWLLFTLVLWSLALLSKEHSIMLPVILILIDVYVFSHSMRTRKDLWYGEIVSWVVPAAVLGGSYLALRFLALAGSIGSYSVTLSQISVEGVIKTLLNIVLSAGVFVSEWRWVIVDYVGDNILIGAGAALVIVAVVFVVLREYVSLAGLLIASFVFSLLPMLLFSFDRISGEGERFFYTPSIFIVILFGLIVVELMRVHDLFILLFAGMIVYSGVFLTTNHLAWQRSGDVNQSIVEQIPNVMSRARNDHVLVLGLPEANEQAHILRNGFAQMTALWYPGFSGEIERLPLYTRLSGSDLSPKLTWERVDNGYITKNSAKLYGKANYESEHVLSELWNYDYKFQTGDRAKLLFRVGSTQKTHLDRAETKILYFSENKLQYLNTAALDEEFENTTSTFLFTPILE